MRKSESKIREVWLRFVESDAFIPVSCIALGLPIITAIVVWGVPAVKTWAGLGE